MLFPIKQLLEDKKKPLCVSRDITVRDALTLMVENDYSQLPIVDEDGRLSGIITDQVINSTYFHTDGAISLLDLPVVDCQTGPVTLEPGSDIFEALDRMERVYAIVVVEDGKPVGILTDYDTTHFFRELTEGLILVEDIEVSLRQYIDTAFPSENELNIALINAFGALKDDPEVPKRLFDQLTFGASLHLITNENNWEIFEGVFGSIELFGHLMNQVRQIRNQLVHFRGGLEPIQHNALIRGRDWLAARPKFPSHVKVEKDVVKLQVDDIPQRRSVGKYDPLSDYLRKQREKSNQIIIIFNDIEQIIGNELPTSARSHRSWWANTVGSHVQANAWMSAGWKVDDVDFSLELVSFKQTNHAFMHVYFQDLLDRLKKHSPGMTKATKTYLQNWFQFGAGRSGFYFGWAFGQGSVFRTELYFDAENIEANKKYFDKLFLLREQIEKKIGNELIWDRLDHRRACRVSLNYPHDIDISQPPVLLEDSKTWALTTVLKFANAFQPLFKDL